MSILNWLELQKTVKKYRPKRTKINYIIIIIIVIVSIYTR